MGDGCFHLPGLVLRLSCNLHRTNRSNHHTPDQIAQVCPHQWKPGELSTYLATQAYTRRVHKHFSVAKVCKLSVCKSAHYTMRQDSLFFNTGSLASQPSCSTAPIACMQYRHSGHVYGWERDCYIKSSMLIQVCNAQNTIIYDTTG